MARGLVMPDLLATLDGISTEEFEIPADIFQLSEHASRPGTTFSAIPGPTSGSGRICRFCQDRPGEFEKG